MKYTLAVWGGVYPTHLPTAKVEFLGWGLSPWGNVWGNVVAHRESIYWSMRNKVVTVGFIVDIDDKCHVCSINIPITIACRFWDHKVAHRAWGYSMGNTPMTKVKNGLGMAPKDGLGLMAL